jgi:glycerol-3-phosphate acyltransferase PlsY
LLEMLAAIAFGYLVGSIPTAYLVARAMKGIDIRTVGSGNVGGSNVWLHAGKVPSVTTLLFDLVKGALAISVLNRNGVSEGAQLAAGIAAIAGHNWPVWLRFVGGRGIATSGGVLFMFGPLETIITGILLGTGAIGFKQGAVATLLAFACWPFMAAFFGRPPEVVAGGALVWLLIIARRLQGSPGLKRVTAGESVYWNRFWFDRDIKDETAWVTQEK